MIQLLVYRFIRHFSAHLRRAKWQFFWRITVENIAVSITAGVILIGLLDMPERRSDSFSGSALMLIVGTVIVAPILETLLFQALPVWIACAFGAGFWARLFFSVVPFAAAHFQLGASVGICAGIIGGLYFGFAYVRWLEVSFWDAFAMAAILHATRNAFVVTVLLVARCY